MQVRFLIGLTTVVAAMSASTFSFASAQTREVSNQIGQATPAPVTRPAQTDFEGRGVAQGSAFTRGRNANATLTINRDTYTYELIERGGRARVRYEGVVNRRQATGATGANSFTIDGRVQRFSASENLRLINVSTGNCRVEVFDARVISSNCRSAIPDSSTQFLGLEQF